MADEFRIAIDDSDLADLTARLRATRRPIGATRDGGVSLVEIDALLRYWLETFDWRAQEASLNRLPHFLVDISGTQLHFIHATSPESSAMPLLLLHGWPGSFVEMRHIVPRLATDFHVVVPSLPGYAFSKLPGSGYSNSRMADVMADLMSTLGYEEFGIQGGDVGAGVGTWLALKHPDRVKGLHLNYIPGSYSPFVADTTTASEGEFLRQKEEWATLSGAYGHVQRTRPLTLGYGLGDSPVGLAAWIFEKFVEWSEPSTRPSLDDILTNISIYWFTNTIASSIRVYLESARTPLQFDPATRVEVPTGVLKCRHEAPFPPRSWVERGYNVTRWTESETGGHFAALEVPDLFVTELRIFLKSGSTR